MQSRTVVAAPAGPRATCKEEDIQSSRRVSTPWVLPFATIFGTWDLGACCDFWGICVASGGSVWLLRAYCDFCGLQLQIAL